MIEHDRAFGNRGMEDDRFLPLIWFAFWIFCKPSNAHLLFTCLKTLGQEKYAMEVVIKFGMGDAKVVSTPFESGSTLGMEEAGDQPLAGMHPDIVPVLDLVIEASISRWMQHTWPKIDPIYLTEKVRAEMTLFRRLFVCTSPQNSTCYTQGVNWPHYKEYNGPKLTSRREGAKIWTVEDWSGATNVDGTSAVLR